MARWSQGGHWSSSGDATAPIETSALRHASLGAQTAGTTVAAGTVLPATSGDFVLTTNANTWIRITGTAAEPGDLIFHRHGGNPISAPTNPAKRYISARLPGEPGAALANGTIELALSSTNPDNSVISWWLVKGP